MGKPSLEAHSAWFSKQCPLVLGCLAPVVPCLPREGLKGNAPCCGGPGSLVTAPMGDENSGTTRGWEIHMACWARLWVGSTGSPGTPPFSYCPQQCPPGFPFPRAPSDSRPSLLEWGSYVSSWEKWFCHSGTSSAGTKSGWKLTSPGTSQALPQL